MKGLGCEQGGSRLEGAQGKEVPPKWTRELERETDGRRKSREQAWEVLGKDNL